MKSLFLIQFILASVFSFSLFATEPPLGMSDFFARALEREKILEAIPAPEELPKYVEGLSKQEQQWLTQWLYSGVLATDRYPGTLSTPIHGDYISYTVNCPPSQMRYLLMELYKTPPPAVPDITHAGIINAMVSCKDQTVIDLARTIAKKGIGNLSSYMMDGLLAMQDDVITDQIFSYLRDETNDQEHREWAFRSLWGSCYRLPKSTAIARLKALKEIAGQVPENSKFSPYREIVLVNGDPRDITEEVFFDECGLWAARAIQGDNAQYPLSESFCFGPAPIVAALDRHFVKKDSEWQSSLIRYLVLKDVSENSLDWYSPEDLAYIADEYAKLAPKFADQEKALADAEAAYIAKYPDRAPVPIAK